MVAWDALVRPMLAQSAEEPFDSPDWIFEVKWDGTRVICFHGDRVRFQNRRFKDIRYRYPEIQVTGPRAIYDGEIVVLRGGLPNFIALQEREHLADPRAIAQASIEKPASYVVFDVLRLEDEDLTRLPLQRRKEILAENLGGANVVGCDYIRGRGRDLFHVARDRGLEGIIAKRLSSRYLEGKRSKDWLKIKATKTIDAVVCGLTRGVGSRATTFGALILGAYRDGQLFYIGRVGTGFDEALLSQILDLTRGLEGPCPFPVPPPEPEVLVWLRPALVSEVCYLEFTPDGALRAPSFMRLRDDKPPGECLLPPGAPVRAPGARGSVHWRRGPGRR